jgi:putative transposase
VKQFDLKSEISNQIINKYGNNKKLKKVKSIKLVVPGRCCNVNNDILTITCIKQSFGFKTKYQYTKINQIEIDNHFYYVSISVEGKPQFQPEGWIGIDRNTTGHCLVAACDKAQKVMMLGKS